MTRLILIMLFAFLNGCATAEVGRQITQDQAAWIQRGVTTRSEVVGRLVLRILNLQTIPTPNTKLRRHRQQPEKGTPARLRRRPKFKRPRIQKQLTCTQNLKRLSCRSTRMCKLRRISFGSSMTRMASCRILALLADLG